jgi:hypothetical protein
MKTSTKITVALVALAITTLGFIGVYILGTMHGKTEVKTQLVVNESAAYEVAKLATYEQTGNVRFSYTNKVAEEGGFLNQAKNIAQNFLFERTVTVDGFYIATYGVELDSNSCYFQPNVLANEIYITLPEPELLFYQTPDDSLHPRTFTEDNGALVLERNTTVRDMESKWYIQGRDAALQNKANIEGAKQKMVKVFESIFGGTTGKKVFVKFIPGFKGYQKPGTKIPSQNL